MSGTNPKVVRWTTDLGQRLFTIMMHYPPKGEMRWMGDGSFPSTWGHEMDVDGRCGRAPKLFESEEEARAAVESEVIPYIVRWQGGLDGWGRFIRGWNVPPECP